MSTRRRVIEETLLMNIPRFHSPSIRGTVHVHRTHTRKHRAAKVPCLENEASDAAIMADGLRKEHSLSGVLVQRMPWTTLLSNRTAPP